MAAEGYHHRNLFQSGYLLGEWQPANRLAITDSLLSWTTATTFMLRKVS